MKKEPGRNFFQVADEIYSKSHLLPTRQGRSQPSLRSKTVLELSHRDAAPFNKFSMKEPHLVSKEAKDPESRLELLHALRKDLRSFYFYKQRHLFKRRNYAFQEISPLKTDATVSKRTVMTHTPIPRLHKFTPSPTPPKPISPFPSRKPKGKQIEFNASIRTLIGKCGGIDPRNDLKIKSERDRNRLKDLRKDVEWTRSVLDQVTGCEASILLPYVESQREAVASFTEDVYRMVEDRKRTHQDAKAAVRFAHLLRSCRNILI